MSTDRQPEALPVPDLVKKLRGLAQGFEEWRVENPDDGSFCISFTRDDVLSPEQAARGWLSEHLLRHPGSQFAGYVVKKHVVKTLKDRALDEAADALDRLHAENEALRKEAAKSERRAITFGDIVHQQVIAMRAAVVASERLGPDEGMRWIANGLRGPGHLPGEEDIALGAQQLYDKEMAAHEAFRAAHPGPAEGAAMGREVG